METCVPCSDAWKTTSDVPVTVASMLSSLEILVRTHPHVLATEPLVVSNQLGTKMLWVLLSMVVSDEVGPETARDVCDLHEQVKQPLTPFQVMRSLHPQT